MYVILIFIRFNLSNKIQKLTNCFNFIDFQVLHLHLLSHLHPPLVLQKVLHFYNKIKIKIKKE